MQTWRTVRTLSSRAPVPSCCHRWTETVEPAQTEAEVQEDPAVAGQEAWGDCIAEGNTPAECRKIVDGG